jgi:CrcB protein
VGLVIAALLVAVGGTAGPVGRHLLGERIDERTRDTLLVNVLGSLLLGGLLGAGVDASAGHLLATGFCGAFTTFSTFAVETVRLAETGEHRAAAINGLVNLVAALCAIWLGTTLGTGLAG